VLKFLFAWILIFSFSISSYAQQFVGVKDWNYQPVDSNFWNDLQILLEQKEFSKASEVIEAHALAHKDSLSVQETFLAVGSLCRAMGYQGCAQSQFLRLLQVAPTSTPAAQALVYLDKDQASFDVDEEELRRLINAGSFKEVPENTMPMANYFVVIDNLKKGKPQWARTASALIPEESFWGFRIQFYNILVKLGRNTDRSMVKEAITSLEALNTKTQSFPILSHAIRLQMARLYFELEVYDQAETIYKNFHFAKRDYGRTLLERSWIRYFQKDYSVALGILETLKAPFFRTSLDPETYVLSSLIYRDLCHYSSATEAAQGFERRFQSIRAHIKKRLSLESDPDLMRMAMVHPPFQGPANAMSAYLQDLESIENDKNIGRRIKDIMKTVLNRMQKEMRGRLVRQMKAELNVVSDKVLDVAEQIKILDYVVKLDEFRIKPTFEKRDYKTEKVETLAIDKLYWPSKGEFWWDELPFYRVLISDRCQAQGVTQ
jgi:hypothetical protein